MMRVLITGANGFLGRNLQIHLSERNDIDVLCFTHEHILSELPGMLERVDFVFHFAGVNRPDDVEEFRIGNIDLTTALCEAIKKTTATIPIVFTSSIHVESSSPYAKSKLEAEQVLKAFSVSTKIPVYIFRLPNVFGKWCRPNYNSVVATFCYNIAHNLPIKINEPDANIRLVYIDDVVTRFVSIMDGAVMRDIYCDVDPEYELTVGKLATKLKEFNTSRKSLIISHVGTGLERALYSTYLSYLPSDSFSYQLENHNDKRGAFVEVLKTKDSGQFSYFTAHPGVTRGGHYHHTKTEKFLVLKGKALFKFYHIYTKEYFEIQTHDGLPTIVETVPGWAHDITNIGEDEMIVMLWANEIFDHDHPDTFEYSVQDNND